ncbi:MAG: zinc-dependent alcohol dehydrogenase family protein [Bacillota bacterium]
MKAAVFNKPGKIEVKEISKPGLSSGEVLVKVKATGICGTDHHIFQGEAPADFPVVPGHEMSGVVEKKAENVTKVDPGDKVTVNPNIHCGHCYYCQRGEINLCENLQAVGVTQNGGFAEYVVIPETNIHKLEDEISFEEGAMIEPISCCLHGIDLADIKPGDKVVIIGGGAIGLILAQLARISGAAEVFISEPEKSRQLIAKELGFNKIYSPEAINKSLFDFSDPGADIVIEAVGLETTIRQSLKLVRSGGTVLLFGVSPENLDIPLSPFQVYKKELTIKGSNINPFVTERALDLLNSNKVIVDNLISSTYVLEQLPDIFSGKIKESGIKSIIYFKN